MVKRQTFALLVFACAKYRTILTIEIDSSIWREEIGNRNRLVIFALADDDDEVNDDAIIVVLI